MERKNTPKKSGAKGLDREARLKAALKANMSRRKAQARSRADDTTQVPDDGQDKE